MTVGETVAPRFFILWLSFLILLSVYNSSKPFSIALERYKTLSNGGQTRQRIRFVAFIVQVKGGNRWGAGLGGSKFERGMLWTSKVQETRLPISNNDNNASVFY